MMSDFIIGRKIGMTRIFDNIGSDYPVTVVEAGPCTIVQIKSIENDGYSAIQMGFLDKDDAHVKKAEKGHFSKIDTPVKRIIKELTSVNLFQNLHIF